VELYDLSNDRPEKKNVADAYPETVERLQNQITEIIAKGRTTAGASQPNDTGYWPALSWMTEEQYNQLQPQD
jgi:hypothetical protein